MKFLLQDFRQVNPRFSIYEVLPQIRFFYLNMLQRWLSLWYRQNIYFRLKRLLLYLLLIMVSVTASIAILKPQKSSSRAAISGLNAP